MKTLDKIYLPKEEIKERMPWIATSYNPNWDECYIRKDALLEWASGEIKRLKQGYKEKWLDGKVPYGGVLAMQNLIDKLNDM